VSVTLEVPVTLGEATGVALWVADGVDVGVALGEVVGVVLWVTLGEVVGVAVWVWVGEADSVAVALGVAVAGDGTMKDQVTLCWFGVDARSWNFTVTVCVPGARGEEGWKLSAPLPAV
jgi:hypothetical protein